MQIALQHKFYNICFDRRDLFKGMISKNTGDFNPNTCSVAAYMKMVISQANGPLNALSDGMFRWEPSKYVGDGFEIFVEALIKTMGLHTDIGVADYVPQPGKDNGVDGAGKGILDLQTVTVQAKYRPREDALLAAGKDRLDSFFSSSVVHHGISPKWAEDGKFIGQKPMLVITTAKDLTRYTKEEKFKGSMRCVGSVWLGNKIDGNTAFWKQFHDLMI